MCGRKEPGGCKRTNDGLLWCRIGTTHCAPDEATHKKAAVTVIGSDRWYYSGSTNDGGGWNIFKLGDREPEKVGPVQSWDYKLVNGEHGATVYRQDYDDGTKKIWRQKVASKPAAQTIAPYGRIGEVTYIVEGETNCDAMLALGLDAICFIGGSDANVTSLTAAEGAVFVLCPDCDIVGRKLMRRAADHLRVLNCEARWLYAGGAAHQRWQEWTSKYDVKNWIESGATADDIKAAVIESEMVTINVSADFWESIPKEDKLKRFETEHDLAEHIIGHAGRHIRWNELTTRIEINGQDLAETDAALSYIDFGARKIKVQKNQATDVLRYVSRKHCYHPIRDYLANLKDALDDESWDNVARVLIKPDATEFDSVVLQKWLVAAVRRVFMPGCAHHFAYVLAGPQGAHKTWFFKALCGNDWFEEAFDGDLKDKDNLRKAARRWIVELGEVDGITGKRAATEIKNFITRDTDSLRVPYARDTEEFPRGFILCATTNKSTGFLIDDTGNRRFYICEIQDPINIDRVTALRNLVWGRAMREMDKGVSNHMDWEETQQQNELNRGWYKEDLWENDIASYVEMRKLQPYFRPEILLTDALKMEAKELNNGHLMRISLILSSMGFEKQRIRENGRRVTVYKRTESLARSLSTGGSEGV